jgi:pyruvate dehydrogenase E1 component beta subunit
MSGGQLSLPLVVRAAHGGGIGFGAQHSQAATSWLLPFPGIKIVAPATPAEVEGLLRAAIRDPDPVLVLEHKALYGLRGPGAAPDAAIPGLGTPRLARAGRDVTIVSLAGTVRRAESAAEELAREGVDCELIDLRGLVPLDERPIVESVRRTGRLLAVQEEPAQGGWAGGLVSRLVQAAWPALTAPPAIVSGADVPIPYAPTLERASSASSDEIVAAVRALVASEVEA